jgi:sulfatase maturation enzyme AslB (radical SAM superfamily)
MVQFAQARNQRSNGKTLNLRLLSNFSAMTDEAAAWLVSHDVQIFTTFDGPASVHDWNRQWMGGTAHAEVVRWMDDFGRRYIERGGESDWRVQALLRTTRRTLEAWRDVVDEYAARGLRTIHLRPLDAFRFDPRTWEAIGYGVEEYLDFYGRALDHILELNRQGVELTERTAAIVLAKI